jgi:hypothetical protein
MTTEITTEKTNPADYWSAKLEECKASGMTKKAFCAQNQIKIWEFYHWNKILSGKQSNKFVKIKKKPAHSSFQSLNGYDIMLAEGLRIRVAEGFNPATLKQLIRTLRETGC